VAYNHDSVCMTRWPPDCTTARLHDCETAPLRDCKTARPQDCKTARPQDCKTARLQDRKTERPQDRKTARPQDRSTARPLWNMFRIFPTPAFTSPTENPSASSLSSTTIACQGVTRSITSLCLVIVFLTSECVITALAKVIRPSGICWPFVISSDMKSFDIKIKKLYCRRSCRCDKYYAVQ